MFRRASLQVRREGLRQNLHEERGTDPTQKDTQRTSSVSLRPLREALRQEGPPEEAFQDALPAQRGVRCAGDAAAGRMGDVPLRAAHVWVLKDDCDVNSVYFCIFCDREFILIKTI